MKLLILVFAALGVATLVMPVMTAAVIATHPWLAVTALTGPIQVVVPMPTPPSVGGGSADVLDVARDWLGVPYAFGGCSRRGVDCSCLVMLVYRAVGVNLPRTAAEQYGATARIADRDLQPGDLVFFANTYMPGISHVGIYIGGGLQINAPTEGQTVSVQPVFSAYWGEHYAGAGRVRR